MRKFIRPALAVGAGIAASWSLQAAGVVPIAAKLVGLAIVAVMLVVFWRRSAAL